MKKIKSIITNDFLEEFIKQLGTLNKEIVILCNSTNRWAFAFYNACHNTNKIKLWEYYDSLNWHESDDFDYELTNILIERKLIC